MSGSVVRSSSADVRELSGRCISPHLHPPTADLMAGVISASRRPHLALDGDDLQNLSLQLRKNNLACLLARRADGIHLAPFEQGEIGPDLFSAA
jgi:hypothetical protein